MTLLSGLLTEQLSTYKKEMVAELNAILHFWANDTFDVRHGGFIGKMDNDGHIDEAAPKGLVLNTRILWSFSAGYRLTQEPKHLEAAQRAFVELTTRFWDADCGGFFWAIAPNGAPLNARKQIYGLAFAIYGLSEYYKVSHDEKALQCAIDTFEWIEKTSFNATVNGYWEAFQRDGSALDDFRLSDKDRNEPLSMNTHLHVLEAYTNLYRVWSNERLKRQTENLIDIFLFNIITIRKTKSGDKKVLNRFFAADWTPTEDGISYGHDIEAAWLLQEAAEVTGYKVAETQQNAVDIALSAADGLNIEGALLYESHLPEKHWWVQAEAMVGFFNAFQLTQAAHFLEKSLGCWSYVKQNLKDSQRGEWFWGITEGGQIMDEDKVGFWKCPYHNARACLELIDRIEKT